jgi:2-succinyl-5-enolpyruvyl-6-hydroxy-3-cyclohexene-1-carboxylate synthase
MAWILADDVWSDGGAMALRPEDLQATFCATLVDEWARDGVVHAVVCPGSRSTPLALALVAHGGIEVHVHHDERSGGFLALGLALGTLEPTVVLTTSGTAAVELHPAVVEADLARVPLLVCTADRPPELLDVGAAQAIDQTHLFGRAVRWFHAPGVADEAAALRWRALAARAYAEATGPPPGPVHLNLAFREPLVGTAAALPPGRGAAGAWAWRPPAPAPAEPTISLVDDLGGRRGVIVAGAGSGSGATIDRVAEALGWPVLAAPQAPVWGHPTVVPGADPLLRTAVALEPEVLVRLGGPLASRVVGEWLAASGAVEIVAAGEGAWVDPHGTATVVLPIMPDALLDGWSTEIDQVEPVDEGRWAARWQELGRAARAAIDRALDAEPAATEPRLVRELVDSLPSGARLVVSSSMPIRDLEWYVQPEAPLEVYANRGANGIDGVVSTAVGLALADKGRPTALLIGDVAFLHDSNGLLGAARRGIDLVVVVVDNDGGGIFSFLPQAAAVDAERFERLYGTPHGLDLAALAAAYAISATQTVDVAASVAESFAAGGVHVLVARTDRRANVEVHRRLNDAVADAVSSIDG